jgi:hypothetical protein
VWRGLFGEAHLACDPPLPPKKIFAAKFALPQVTDYTVDQSPEFWVTFPKSSTLVGKS